MRVWAPKTEHHDGQGHRIVPIFPELRPYMEAVWDQAEPGETHFITRYRETNANLRTQLIIIRRAGLEPWPKLFQNPRASRQTELEEIFTSHVVNKWIGNSRRVAEKHYLQVTEDHFRKATSGAAGGALHMRSSDALQTVANEKSDVAKPAEECDVSQ